MLEHLFDVKEDLDKPISYVKIAIGSLFLDF